MFDEWCRMGISYLEPAMIIAVDRSPSGAGRQYGHVGIYVGDNKVMHSVDGKIRTTLLSSWLDYYGSISTPKCGWIGGVDLSL